MTVVGWLLVVAGIAIVATAAMARAGRLSRQSWIGIRTRTTMTTDEAWYAAHEAGGAWIIAGGAIMALGGLLVVFTEDEDIAAWVSLGVCAAAVVPILIGGFRGQAAARSVR